MSTIVQIAAAVGQATDVNGQVEASNSQAMLSASNLIHGAQGLVTALKLITVIATAASVLGFVGHAYTSSKGIDKGWMNIALASFMVPMAVASGVSKGALELSKYGLEAAKSGASSESMGLKQTIAAARQENEDANTIFQKLASAAQAA